MSATRAVDLVAAIGLTLVSALLLFHDTGSRYDSQRIVESEIALAVGYALGVFVVLAWLRWFHGCRKAATR